MNSGRSHTTKGKINIRDEGLEDPSMNMSRV